MTDAEKAKLLQQVVANALQELVEDESKAIDIEPKFIWAEIAYVATQKARDQG